MSKKKRKGLKLTGSIKITEKDLMMASIGWLLYLNASKDERIAELERQKSMREIIRAVE